MLFREKKMWRFDARAWVNCAAGVVLGACMLACPNVKPPELSRPMSRLRIGIIPDRDREDCKASYTPLAEYLGDALGVESDLSVANSYRDLVDRFGAGEFDLALFEANTFLIAHERYAAVPLVLRDTDLRFTSLFIASTDSKAESLEDLKGADFAFGPHLSTSGNLMAREYLLRNGFVPESFFGKIRFTVNHAETVALVREGEVAAGVVNSRFVREMMSDGRLADGDIHLVAETEPYADYVWVVSQELPSSTRARLRSAFLALSLGESGQHEILDRVDAKYFRPANLEQFDRAASVISWESAEEGA
jgi:phosphonate transport system substrate-binding protein